jgi:hypothetical protein
MAGPGAKVVGIKAQVPKVLNGHVAACTTGTAQEEGAILGKSFRGQVRHEVHWKMDTSWYVPEVIFLSGPDIHHDTALI